MSTIDYGNASILVDETSGLRSQMVSLSESNYVKVLNAQDLVKSFTYLDEGTADERINTIVYSSIIIGNTITETITYAGTTGKYRISSITRIIS